MNRLNDCPAPAKLNLFLHIIGRRADGYHLLQSVFRLIDRADTLSFEERGDGCIELASPIPGIPPDRELCVRAATLLQKTTGCSRGATIRLDKHLPMGGGLGGGSSDAATTLIALNRLWGTGLRRNELAAIGLRLGADVPFFIAGRDAFVEGIGERITPVELTPARYVVIVPPVEVPTAAIFAAGELTRDSEPIKIADFASRPTRNDLQAVACKLHPAIGEVIEWLGQYAPARMTGSGACVFAQVHDELMAARIIKSCPPHWRAWQAGSLARHPLYEWLDS
ncbi:MAG TPA: 4-(cytidine 5'-diphospho)-2-C-methyl-D-erythritol kinase [Azoarcus taiwanensis]|nr:4-(cytidine 5'-diphospho)-2-C-methyl-D-erythritol kinase [Azoarcus taiwanensis]